MNSFPASHNLAHSSLSRRGDLSQRGYGIIYFITFTPVSFLNLTDKGVLEHGDGWNHSRPGYYRFNGPLFHSQHGRGTDGVEYELYSFSNEYTELVWGD